MLRIDCGRWGQTPEDLRRLAVESPHPRTRERFLALYEITEASCASGVAGDTGRHDQTVIRWVHWYNEQGPDALTWRHTGGTPFFASGSKPPSTPPSAPPSRRPRPRR